MAGTGRDFGALLDELITASEAERAASAHIDGVDFLAVMGELESAGIFGAGHAAASYGEMAAERQPPRQKAAEETVVPPPPLPSIDLADIRRELRIDGVRKPAELDALRRQFAFANHPDRVVPALRERAEQRMRIANMLVDDAKRSAGRA